MSSLGLRASSTKIYIAIYNQEDKRIVNVEKVFVPKSLSKPKALRYVRNTIIDILREYSIKTACIRVTESSAKVPNIDRVQIEAVIQEAFASSFLDSYICAQIATLTSILKIPRSDFKLYISNEKEYESVENWSNFGKEEREAVFAAIGAANV